MGQYHIPVNLDKKQFIDPRKLGSGLKLWEQLANAPGTQAALIILIASASNGKGGGDLKVGPEVIGSWRGDRIAMVGDYDDDTYYRIGEGPLTQTGADIYTQCGEAGSGWTDVSDAVAAVLESELDGKFSGDGWRDWKAA